MNKARNAGTDVPRGFGLAARLFLAFALLALLTLGAAAGVTVMRGNAVADKAIAEQLAHSLSIQGVLEHNRFTRLELITKLFAADPYFASYVAQAQQADLGFGGTADSTSVTDLLAERQTDLGFDFAFVLDAEGNVIARTDGKPLRPQSLADNAVAGPVIASLEPRTGYWSHDNGVFQVAVVPLADGFALAGFLIAGLRVDNALAQELHRASGAHFMVVQKRGAAWMSIAGTPPENVASAILSGLEPASLPVAGESRKLAGGQWRVAAEALDGSGAAYAVTLTDEDAALAGYRAIQAVLAFAALAALGAAVLLGATISRSLAKPLRDLADAADDAAEGNFHEPLPSGGGRELSQLTNAFNRLLSNLREKSDMERFLADLARLQPEPGQASRAETAATIEQGWLIGLNWKPEISVTLPADQQLQSLERTGNCVSRSVAGFRGRLLELGGSSAIVFVPGDAPVPAAAAAGRTLRELAGLHVMAGAAILRADITSGEVITGGVRRGAWQASTENALRQLAMESIPGGIMVAKNVGQELLSQNVAIKVGTGRLTGKNFYTLRAADAEQIGLGDDDQTLALTQVAAATTTSTAATALKPGMLFGERFEILSELGRGGMGAVFKAMDRELREPVALKVLLAGATMNADEREAMKTEIRLARRITHPNILRTHDFGDFDGVPYITMEYVRGLTLKFLVQQCGRLPDSAALRIARQVCAGLDAAHAQGVLHRDIKPENIILEPTGNAKLMDFGIAQIVSRDSGAPVQVAGTPRYAAPEQMLGEALDARADIYSLGVVMYQMFTGTLPHRAPSIEELVAAKRAGVEKMPGPAVPARPAGIDALVLSCLAGLPADRPASAAELLARLASITA